MDISIIIINWNVCDLLYQCLKSVFLFTQQLDVEVIVVDNHSIDGSRDMLDALTLEHPNLRVIFNEDNKGFAVANNQGLRLAQGKYVLFMNPDMEFVENTAKALFDYMQAHRYIAACTCQLQYGDGSRQPNVKRDPTLLSQLWILYKLHHLWQPAFLKKYLAKDFDYSIGQEVEQVMGAFLFIRRDIVIALGGWSEDYFIWWEDIDLCKRLRKIGEHIMYVPISHVIHYESKSFSQQGSFAKQKRFNRAMLTYFKKYHSWLAQVVLRLATIDSLALAAVAQGLGFKQKPQSQL